MSGYLTRRNFLRAGIGAAAACTLINATSPWARGATTRPVRRGLFIGLDRVSGDANHWGKPWTGALYGPTNDARQMREICKSNFLETHLLTDNPADNDVSDRATLANVMRYLAGAAEVSQPGDLFVIYFSGHGSFVELETGGDEPDRQDETWCLWDGHFIDDLQYTFWRRFASGVRILGFADSCHSETSTKAAAAAALAKSGDIQFPTQEQTEKFKAAITKQAGEYGDTPEKRVEIEKSAPPLADRVSMIKGMPIALVRPSSKLQGNRIESELVRYKSIGDESRTRGVLSARGLLFGACSDQEEALASGDPKGLSLFTSHLVPLLRANPDITYRQLHQKLHESVSHPKPTIFDDFGQSFIDEKIFTIG